MNKYEKLEKIMRKMKINKWAEIKEYMEQFSKYDNWTYRDIDKVYKLIKKR